MCPARATPWRKMHSSSDSHSDSFDHGIWMRTLRKYRSMVGADQSKVDPFEVRDNWGDVGICQAVKGHRCVRHKLHPGRYSTWPDGRHSGSLAGRGGGRLRLIEALRPGDTSLTTTVIDGGQIVPCKSSRDHPGASGAHRARRMHLTGRSTWPTQLPCILG